MTLNKDQVYELNKRNPTTTKKQALTMEKSVGLDPIKFENKHRQTILKKVREIVKLEKECKRFDAKLKH